MCAWLAFMTVVYRLQAGSLRLSRMWSQNKAHWVIGIIQHRKVTVQLFALAGLRVLVKTLVEERHISFHEATRRWSAGSMPMDRTRGVGMSEG